MKFTKPTIVTLAVIASVSITGIAAAYSDIQIIPTTRPSNVEQVKRPEPAPVRSEVVSETPNSDTGSDDRPTTDTQKTATPLVNSETNTNNEVSNEPAPEVEFDPTPEPLPAPATNTSNVSNENNVLGNNSTGNISNN